MRFVKDIHCYTVVFLGLALNVCCGDEKALPNTQRNAGSSHALKRSADVAFSGGTPAPWRSSAREDELDAEHERMLVRKHRESARALNVFRNRKSDKENVAEWLQQLNNGAEQDMSRLFENLQRFDHSKNGNTECLVCLETIEHENPLRYNSAPSFICDLGHVSCNTCTAAMLKAQISDGATQFFCPGLLDGRRCTQPINAGLLSFFLQKADMDNLYCNTFHAKGWRECATINCHCMLSRTQLRENKLFDCGRCEQSRCVHCNQADHWPAICMQEQNELATETELSSGRICRSCPHCKVNVEHAGQCNEIRCVCGASFCYGCGDLLASVLQGRQIDGYTRAKTDHYQIAKKCPLYPQKQIAPPQNNRAGVLPPRAGVLPPRDNRAGVVPQRAGVLPQQNNGAGVMPQQNNRAGVLSPRAEVVPQQNNGAGIVPQHNNIANVIYTPAVLMAIPHAQRMFFGELSYEQFRTIFDSLTLEEGQEFFDRTNLDWSWYDMKEICEKLTYLLNKGFLDAKRSSNYCFIWGLKRRNHNLIVSALQKGAFLNLERYIPERKALLGYINEPLVQSILQAADGFDERKNFATRLLDLAIVSTNDGSLQTLLKAGANLKENVNGDPLIITVAKLYRANLKGDIGSHLKTLAAQGLQVDARSAAGETALHLTVNVDLFNSLVVNHKMCIESRDASGKTALHSAALRGDYKIVNEALRLHASVHARNNVGQIPLHLSRTTATTKLLIDRHSNIKAKDHEGRTPLHTIMAHASSIQPLLKAGADVNEADNHGNVAIHALALSGNLAQARELRRHGVDPNALNSLGHPPLLILTVNNACQQSVRYLLPELIKMGANINFKSADGKTLLEMATELGGRIAVERLRKLGIQ